MSKKKVYMHWSQQAGDVIGNVLGMIVLIGIGIGAAVVGGIWAIVHYVF